MAHWENDWGEEFETEEDAREDVVEKMDWSAYEDELQYTISWHTLFEWARQQDGFFERFETNFYDAENEFFKANYHEVEDDEEDDF